MDTFECLWKSFVVAGESSEACDPCEAGFDDPSAWQQDEASFGHGVLDHFKPDAVLLGGFRGVGPGVALVHIGKLDCVASHALHVFSKRTNLRSITLVCGSDPECEQVAQRIDRDVDLRSLARAICTCI